MSSSSSQASFSDSVSDLLEQLKAGKQTAAQGIWSRYVERLVNEAQKRLRNSSRRVADEDDVVNHAFGSFLEGVKQGRYSKLNDRTDLWQVLVMLVERKAIDQIRALDAQKRGNGQTRGDSIFQKATDESGAIGFDGIVDPHPSPTLVKMFCEQFRAFLNGLDEQFREVAILKLQNYTNQEIADIVGISVSSVERKLSIIRDGWRKQE